MASVYGSDGIHREDCVGPAVMSNAVPLESPVKVLLTAFLGVSQLLLLVFSW